MEITIVDAIMGSGKTTAAINYMKEHNSEMKFLFVTPYLDEADRIQRSCPNCNFKTPKKIGTKLSNLKQLLKHGENIVATHALFEKLDEEALGFISEYKYTLFMDEVLETVSLYNVGADDLEMLIQANKIALHKNRTVTWNNTASYSGTFKTFKNDIESKSMFWTQCNQDGHFSIYTVMDTSSFVCFKNIFVLTYLFEGSILKAYFDLHGFCYKYIGVDWVDGVACFSQNNGRCEQKELRDLIHIWMPDAKQSIGEGKRSLSYSWFLRRKKDDKDIIMLKKNISSFYRNISKTKSPQNLWTTYKSSKDKLSGPGYAKGFESHNIRATNKHRGRTAVVYAVNKFLNPGVNNFFLAHGVEVDQDKYALSSMLQFIWRSAIRDRKPIWIYIPSFRMQRLFEDWLVEITDAVDPNGLKRVRGRAKNKVVLLNGVKIRKAVESDLKDKEETK